MILISLGDELLRRIPGGIVTRERVTERLTALACHYPPEMPLSVPGSFDSRGTARQTLALGRPAALQIGLTGVRPGARFTIETLDHEHGNALAAWDAMVAPEAPTREQTATLRQRAAATRCETLAADAGGASGNHARGVPVERRYRPRRNLTNVI